LLTAYFSGRNTNSLFFRQKSYLAIIVDISIFASERHFQKLKKTKKYQADLLAVTN
jgi:hypothetical protein